MKEEKGFKLDHVIVIFYFRTCTSQLKCFSLLQLNVSLLPNFFYLRRNLFLFGLLVVAVL